ncbi:MAG: hypothetical protein JW828_07925 [Sedimentisphaerales bacterium]|nr:hypothetical protein [Sedimentisphaerales bacterium]
MHTIDYLIILLYFVIVIGVGFYYRKASAGDLQAYFLGSNRMHWLALAMSGSVSNFDITGTMWIVSILFVLGMRSMWHHWMWGFLMGAFFMSYMGPWIRRSRVMTAAEWMKTRFGEGLDGQLARIASAVMCVFLVVGFIGYAFQGIGKFAAIYLPLEQLAEHTSLPWLQNLVTQYEPPCLAVLIMGTTTLYVIFGGLFGVVTTDVIQTVILTVGSIIIAIIAWGSLTPDALAALPSGWSSLSVPWRMDDLAGTDHAEFQFFGALALVWVAKGLLLNMAGPGQMYDCQRFLAARNDRDAAKIGAAWSLFLVVRWAMTAGIALLALTGVAGVADSEQIMPVVLRDYLPAGVRGLVIAGLLAAFMSTFSSTINSGASFVVRDLWQPYFGKNASMRTAVTVSYLSNVILVVVGMSIGLLAGSIAEIWNWIMMSLTAGVLIPNVLRWYWWRMNGWGYTMGTFAGMAASLVVLGFKDPLPVYVVFPVVCGSSALATVVFTLLTPPTDTSVLLHFYQTIRPFGLWKPVRQRCPQVRRLRGENVGLIGLNVLLGMVTIACIYLCPMYLVGHWYEQGGICIGIALVAVIVLKFTWYNNLPTPAPDPES